MSDLAILAAKVKTEFLEIAKQEGALGTGLQNAAPGDKGGTPNKSIQYLFEASTSLTKCAKQCDAWLSPHAQAAQKPIV